MTESTIIRIVDSVGVAIVIVAFLYFVYRMATS